MAGSDMATGTPKSGHSSNTPSSSPELTSNRSESVQDMDGANEKAPKFKLPGMSASAMKAVKTPTKSPAKSGRSSTKKSGKDTNECSPASPSTGSPRKRTADVDDDDAPQVRAKRSKNTRGHDLIRPSRLMPTFMGGPNIAMSTASGSALTSDFMNIFNSTVYEIILGESEFKFHGHENVLRKSPKFVEAINLAKSKKRRAPRQSLQFDEHDPGAFGQMMQWLYSDKFALIKFNDIPSRLREFTEVMSLAKTFKLPALQKLVVSTFAKSKTITKCSISGFFDWAEDMYYSELDQEDGPFIRFFTAEAPKLLQAYGLGVTRHNARGKDVEEDTTPDETRDGLLKQARDGGEFGGVLFKALHEALILTRPYVVVKDDHADEAKSALVPASSRRPGSALATVKVKTADEDDGTN